MTILKTSSLIPQDLSKLFNVIKDKTVSTAQYLAHLIKYYSLALYSSLGNMVEKLRPNRVTVITPSKFVVIPKALKPQTVETTVQVEPVVLERKEEPVVVERKSQFPTFKDISDRVDQVVGVKIPDLETSLLKVIASAREVFMAPVVNNESLNRQLLDPFHTSAHPEV